MVYREKIKWYSQTEYVDVETGEMITRSEATRKYYKIRTIKKTEIHESIGKINYTIECRRNRQTRIEF